MVVQDEFGPHRDGDMNDDGEFLPGHANLTDCLLCSDSANQFVAHSSSRWDEFDDEPTHEKWRRGPKWN